MEPNSFDSLVRGSTCYLVFYLTKKPLVYKFYPLDLHYLKPSIFYLTHLRTGTWHDSESLWDLHF